MSENDDQNILAETENFIVWRSEDDGEYIYHVELGGVSLHLDPDEWEELVVLMKSV